MVPKFGEITDPKHRNFVQPLLSAEKPNSHPLVDLWSEKRGVVLAYLVREQQASFDTIPKPVLPSAAPDRGLIVGFSMFLPKAAVADDKVLKFRVLHGHDSSVAAVDAPKDITS